MFGLFKKKTAAQKNDKVRAALQGMGDDGSRPRHVIHYAYATRKATGETDEAEAIIRRHISPDVIEATDDSVGFRFEQTREVASDDFDALTQRLEDELAAIHWDYDGWECAVETGEAE